jgi:hypothetical protein
MDAPAGGLPRFRVIVMDLRFAELAVEQRPDFREPGPPAGPRR